MTAALDAHAKGLTLAEADALTKANRNPIRTAVDTYLEQKKSGKAKKTVAQYLLTLNEFIEALQGKVRFLHEITENVLCSYKKFMVNQGYAGKTIDTRLNIVFFLLKKNGIAARIAEFCRKLARAVWKTAAFGPNSAIVAISENEISGQRQRPGSSVASAAP